MSRSKTAASLAAGLVLATSHLGAAMAAPSVSVGVTQVAGIRIFYREAGDRSKPTILLLHGFPSSSNMFRDLMPLLASDFHVLAPDYPGMGFSEAPGADAFTPSFDKLAEITEKFVVQQQGASPRLIVYMQDFGGPVGMRMATRHPDWISGLIFQNTVISLGGWDPKRLAAVQANSGPPTAEKRAAAQARVVPETAVFLHRHGARDVQALDPATWAVDAYVLGNPESRRIMTDLQLDIPSSLPLYPLWQAWLRERQPRTLVVWGRNDPLFSMQAVTDIQASVPDAEVQVYDSGHFALDEDGASIASRIVARFANGGVDRAGGPEPRRSDGARAAAAHEPS